MSKNWGDREAWLKKVGDRAIAKALKGNHGQTDRRNLPKASSGLVSANDEKSPGRESKPSGGDQGEVPGLLPLRSGGDNPLPGAGLPGLALPTLPNHVQIKERAPVPSLSGAAKRDHKAEKAKREARAATQLSNWCAAYGLPRPVTEYIFHPQRRWRFDWAWPDQKVAVEQEGGIWTGGRHVRPRGYQEDMEKYNAAQILGWTVLRYPVDKVYAALPEIKRALGLD